MILLLSLILPLGPAAWSMTAPVVVHGPNILSLKPLEVSSGKKGAVIVFLSAICPCSDSHLAELRALQSEYPEFHFVGVHSNTDESRETTQAYFTKVALPFPVIQDQHGVLADQYRASKTPHAFVLSPDGKILFRGGVSDSHILSASSHKYLRAALEDLQAGRKVAMAEARTLGCAISRRGSYDW